MFELADTYLSEAKTELETFEHSQTEAGPAERTKLLHAAEQVVADLQDTAKPFREDEAFIKNEEETRETIMHNMKTIDMEQQRPHH